MDELGQLAAAQVRHVGIEQDEGVGVPFLEGGTQAGQRAVAVRHDVAAHAPAAKLLLQGCAAGVVVVDH